MTNRVFHAQSIEKLGTTFPEFELGSGKLIRIYVRNWHPIRYTSMRFELTEELTRRFQQQYQDLPYSPRSYRKRFYEFCFPMRVRKYLIKKMQLSDQVAKRIAAEAGVDLDAPMDRIDIIAQRVLMLKAHFAKHPMVIFDFHGIYAMGMPDMLHAVDLEIKKGKSAIAFDLFQYMEDDEPFDYIERVFPVYDQESAL
ncbi:MAG: hypothetical protein AAF570_04910 [Bacteroidota bacterium]